MQGPPDNITIPSVFVSFEAGAALLVELRKVVEEGAGGVGAEAGAEAGMKARVLGAAGGAEGGIEGAEEVGGEAEEGELEAEATTHEAQGGDVAEADSTGTEAEASETTAERDGAGSASGEHTTGDGSNGPTPQASTPDAVSTAALSTNATRLLRVHIDNQTVPGSKVLPTLGKAGNIHFHWIVGLGDLYPSSTHRNASQSDPGHAHLLFLLHLDLARPCKSICRRDR